LGAWDQLDLKYDLQLTARNFSGYLYGYINKEATKGSPGPGTGDTIRIWSHDTGEYRDIDVKAAIEEVVDPSVVTSYTAFHTFDIAYYNNDVVAFCMTQWGYKALGATMVDTIVAISMTTGKTVTTLDGLNYFSLYEQLGTSNTTSAATIYAQAYTKTVAGVSGTSTEEYHGNGVLPFTTSAGDELLGITQFFMNGATIVLNPWKVTKANGGGRIVQRFGMPTEIVSHVFGLDAADSKVTWTACHNLQYTLYPDGRESLTMLVNTISGSKYSWVYEFDIKLVPEGSITPIVDSIFATTYRKTQLPFQTQAEGGARRIGKDIDSSVYLVASGISGLGLYCADSNGDSLNWPCNGCAYYDPYTFINL